MQLQGADKNLSGSIEEFFRGLADVLLLPGHENGKGLGLGAKCLHQLFLVDAGGGTVDLISYEILSKEPFSVREAVRGDGDLCGGVFLDEAFVNFIKDKVGSEAWHNVPEAEARKALNNDWENNIKTAFHGQD
ncbi:hsp70 family chaperone [Colletotrichum musicola]|uniref:Hsp70 family chaperone n=1 Tax=Colletotrichum musicola TaxID=2175873 RepID=A0A8H6NPU9_9PEZI|nr:hsp70 family chaperone [Colletotrichum musicola]